MNSWLTQAVGLFALWIALVCGAGSASAQYCPPSNISIFSATTLAVGAYNPFTTSTPRIVTVTIRTRAACAISLWFMRTPATPVMVQGANTLNYQIEPVGGGNTYVGINGILAPAANRIDIVTTGAQTVTRQVQVRVLNSQIVTSGAYSDAGVTMILASNNAGSWFQVGTVTVTPSATVSAVCRLDAPSPSTLAWAATDIPLGVPNATVIKSSTMSAACTAPTIVRLTGGALALTPTSAAPTGFANFINYRAIGTFGAATATLITTTTASATANSAVKNVVSGATTAGSVGVNVNLIAGNTALAGSYSSVLTVTIDPNL